MIPGYSHPTYTVVCSIRQIHRSNRTMEVIVIAHNLGKTEFYALLRLRAFWTYRSTGCQHRTGRSGALIIPSRTYRVSIHEHYHRNRLSDDQDVHIGKQPHKGKRYCFCCAIQRANPHVDDPVDNADKAGLVEGTIWAFCPQKPEDHKGDYHKVFHSKNFIAWGRGQLLPNLKQPSLIMIDNAKYHKTYPAGTHQISSLCKAQLQAYLESKSEPYGAKDTCVILTLL